MSRFTVYQDTEQWVPFFNWFWQEDPPITRPDGIRQEAHGAYPARWMAWLAGWLGTR